MDIRAKILCEHFGWAKDLVRGLEISGLGSGGVGIPSVPTTDLFGQGSNKVLPGA